MANRNDQRRREIVKMRAKLWRQTSAAVFVTVLVVLVVLGVCVWLLTQSW
jgi:hypothetical protein